MEYEIIPYISFGDLKLGMHRSDIRKQFNETADSFLRSEDSLAPTDAFDSSGIYVNYDSNDLCEAIEAAEPAEPIFLDKSLLNLSYLDVLEWFKQMDPDIKEDDAGFTSYKYGIGLYAPDKEEEPDKPCEGVIAFKIGYYEE